MAVIHLPVVPVIRNELIINSVAAVISLAFVVLRLYSRLIGAGFGWDDGWIIVAVIWSWALFGEQIALRDMGEGYDFDPESPIFPALANNVMIIFQILFSFGIIYLFALASVKLSVLSFYMRTFATPMMRRLIWATMGLVSAWAIAHSLAFVFVCWPTQAFWNPDAGTCSDIIPIYASIVVVNIITDLAIMALPMYTIWHLQMRKTEKVALTLAFGLGFASIIVACKRLSAVFDYDIAANPTGTVGESAFLCVLETFLALLCVNIPLLRPLVRRWYRTTTSKLEGSESGQGSHFKNSKQDANGTIDSGPYGRGVAKVSRGRRRPDEWEMSELGTAVDNTSVDDSGSEKMLNSSRRSPPPPGQVKIQTRWAVTHQTEGRRDTG